MNMPNEELHLELLDITREVIDVCEKNKIRYYLAWGSCLGAVRHHDIIPWDDDVDLYVDYRDLDRLKEAFRGNEQYFYQDLDTDPEYFTYWPKIRKNHTTSMEMAKKAIHMHWGICIDLFPLLCYDKPSVDQATKRKVQFLSILARLPFYKKLGNRSLHKVWKVLYAILGEKGRKKLFFKLLDSINCPEGEYLLDISEVDRPIIMKEDVYGEGTKVCFHDLQAKVPSAYDAYLRLVYGDNYMEIPPEDSELRYFHSTSLVDCHKDYREYFDADEQ